VRLLIVALILLSIVVFGFAQSSRRQGIRYLNPSSLSVPTGYSHVVEVNSGRTIYIAGQVALDKAGNVVGKGDFAAQTTQVFENLKLALAAVGATFDNVVKINTYVTDMSQIQTLRDIRTRYYSKNAPASTLVQIGKLAREELMIEIEAVAVVPE
jgi:reactive intermediate/imine deaminase